MYGYKKLTEHIATWLAESTVTTNCLLENL